MKLLYFILFFSKVFSFPTAKIELPKYQGQWYQIADYPQFYEYFFCNECTRANYIIQANDSVRVINQARGFNDCTIKGIAKISDLNDPGKLSITFDSILKLGGKNVQTNKSSVGAQYWVYQVGDLDKNGLYSWSVVSNENKTTCYVLARTPEITEELYSKIQEFLLKMGFDMSRLKKTQQSSCVY